MYRYAVAPSTVVANCRVKPTDAWQINQSDCRLAGDRVGDRDAPQRKPTKEIVGPVNRIDDPAALSRPSPALLPEKTILRKGLGQARADQRLDLAVGDTDEVLAAPSSRASGSHDVRKIQRRGLQPRGSAGWQR